MGFGGWELLLVALIIVLIFGTKKLRNVGHDLGAGLKSFRKAVKEDETNTASSKDTDVIEGEVTKTQVNTDDDEKNNNNKS